MKEQLPISVDIKTVKELIEMIDNGELRYDTTTQRQFIYNNNFTNKVSSDVTGCGSMSKAGYVLYNIFNKQINLPPVYFWYNTDTGQLNIHDGKQRLLSLYNFVKSNGVNTYIGSMPITTFDALDTDEQNYINDYKLAVITTSGTSMQEEESFYEINSNGVNLTAYENLHAVMYGRYLSEFEEYLESLELKNVEGIGRGDQAYKFLLTMYRINDSKKAGTTDAARKELREALRPKRDQEFDPNYKRFGELIRMFNKLMNIKFKGDKGLSEDISLAIARYSVDYYYERLNDIIELYTTAGKNPRNDILSWASDFNSSSLQSHKCFINAYINDGLTLDCRRNFTDDDKQKLIETFGCKCLYTDTATEEPCKETNVNNLQVDHIKPWSKGGQTIISNAQLLCSTHNKSKGDTEYDYRK